MYLINKILHPEIFQGKYKTKNYFEGWYYKIIDNKIENSLVVIPGVAYGKKNEDSHAFLQIMDATNCKPNYFKYNISSFKYNENKFEVEIGDNYFTNKEISLNIERNDFCIGGKLSFNNIVVYPKTFMKPGIMGPYTFVPFMECYHGIVNIHQEVFGQISLNGNTIDFNKGYGYIEKDWGKSFPEAWIWLQSNHFSKPNTSLMFSLAKIPWLRRYFLGFISFILIEGKLYLFSTYTKAKIIELDYVDNCLKIIVEDKQFRLEIKTKHTKGGLLRAPKNGLMTREILESITALVWVRLIDKDGKMIFEDEGTHTGLEIVSDIFKYYNEGL